MVKEQYFYEVQWKNFEETCLQKLSDLKCLGYILEYKCSRQSQTKVKPNYLQSAKVTCVLLRNDQNGGNDQIGRKWQRMTCGKP